jgi:hypothetical protein
MVNIDLPASGEWRDLDETFTDWTPAYQAPAAELRKYYESNGRKVGLYLGLYTNQKKEPAKDTLQAFLDDIMPAIETALNSALCPG